VSSSRYFHRFGTRRDLQLNITRYWTGLGLRTWPHTYSGRRKRALHFGFGYLSWRIDR